MRTKTNELIRTTPDLYYQQVIDNLVITAAQPNALPFFGLPTQGSDTNTRSVQASYTPGWDLIRLVSSSFAGHFLFDKQGATVQGQLQNAQAFQLQPVFDPDKLSLVHIALRIALGDETLTLGDTNKLTMFYVLRPDHLSLNDEYYYAITHKSLQVQRVRLDPVLRAQAALDFADIELAKDPANTGKLKNQSDAATALEKSKKDSGMDDASLKQPDTTVQKADWFTLVNKKKAVPKHACYVSNHCDLWLWVPPEYMKDFTGFTIAMLDLTSINNIPITPHSAPKPTAFGFRIESIVPPTQLQFGPVAPAPTSYLLTPRVTTFPFPAPPQ